ncbi:MAG: protein adenylyltransferase SelO family protein, partial [Paracoccaceae bacterium]|nr:protein adenylyltransferase SelO family protein [Paracoccaceae bacterium]
NPQLGDGRALLLGETIGSDGVRRDIQLKGSGPTPYSRSGDGRAWLGPVLREYVVSEAMHALRIPTTRALAAVLSGESVLREKLFPGAILTRVASSHIRIGTFQVYAAQRDWTSLKTLLDYSIARHYPHAEGPLGFLEAVIKAQATLIPKWMGVGFIHGVMNTDNCQVAGETIDYGPCAFMDRYHPMQVYSSIDKMGRYAYGIQQDIIVWNMAQLATALVPLMPDADEAIEAFTSAIHAMPGLIKVNWRTVFAAKIGISAVQPEDEGLVNALLKLMADGQADFTNTFAAMGTSSARDQFIEPEKYDVWKTEWQTRIVTEKDPHALMAKSNPVLIPRNHRIEEMISAAIIGDYAPFQRLQTALSAPFEENSEFSDLRRPPSDAEEVRATFCGT